MFEGFSDERITLSAGLTLIQPAPLPERLIGADPDFYLRSSMRAWGRADEECFSPEAVDEYLTSFRDPACISATCADYRAAASIDLQHDSEDEGRTVAAPLLALWGTKGIVGKLYDVVALWQERAKDVVGKGLACGHFLPEEAPVETAEALIRFFSGRHC